MAGQILEGFITNPHWNRGLTLFGHEEPDAVQLVKLVIVSCNVLHFSFWLSARTASHEIKDCGYFPSRAETLAMRPDVADLDLVNYNGTCTVTYHQYLHHGTGG